jgi:phosphopantetheinyl transferase (holo-ACP synthase)
MKIFKKRTAKDFQFMMMKRKGRKIFSRILTNKSKKKYKKMSSLPWRQKKSTAAAVYAAKCFLRSRASSDNIKPPQIIFHNPGSAAFCVPYSEVTQVCKMNK